jgi:hypothetical protein
MDTYIDWDLRYPNLKNKYNNFNYYHYTEQKFLHHFRMHQIY